MDTYRATQITEGELVSNADSFDAYLNRMADVQRQRDPDMVRAAAFRAVIALNSLPQGTERLVNRSR